MKYEKRSQVSMKGHPVLTERWLQGKIVADPSLLGFGDVRVAAQRKSLPGRGRLDLLLLDDDKYIRYEVELQLVATDDHILFARSNIGIWRDATILTVNMSL